MNNTFAFKGYVGSAEVDTESKALVGKLLFIRDVIAYSAETPDGLEKAFREAVDDYLETCKQLGQEPDFPCKGSFNVRVGVDLHREVAMCARAKGMGLNEFVCHALTIAIQRPDRTIVEHSHKIQHEVVIVRPGHRIEQVIASGQPTQWETGYATH